MLDQPTILQFAKSLPFEGYLRVLACESRLSQSGSRFLDMTLADHTGTINAKRWDAKDETYQTGDIVKIRGVVNEFNGKLQLRVDLSRAVTPADNVDVADFVPCAPYPSDYMLEQIIKTVDNMQNRDIRAIVRHLLDKAGSALLTAPAAQRVHHAERGGLLHHTMTMMQVAQAILPFYKHLNADLLLAGVILHDLEKLGEMGADEWGTVTEYTACGQLIGHLVMGVERIHEAGRAAGAGEEAVMLLAHMVLSHHDKPEHGSPKPPMIPEAEALHLIDTLDARMYEMSHALEPIAPGGFTERIWSLERKLYKANLNSD